MAKLMRRLAQEVNSLYSNPPPDFLFPESLRSDELTTLDAYLIGPTSTPYEHGLWRIHFAISQNYPQEPPKATFRTKMWHPNVEERSGEICVDTLKTGWTSTTTLRDVLSTIRSLLIHPNPASALNAEAGMLADEDYKAFARQAKLMTKIHASVPVELKSLVKEARKKAGEEESAAATQPSSSSSKLAETPINRKEGTQHAGLGISLSTTAADHSARHPEPLGASSSKENANPPPTRPSSSGSIVKNTSPLGKRSMDDREREVTTVEITTAEMKQSAAKLVKYTEVAAETISMKSINTSSTTTPVANKIATTMEDRPLKKALISTKTAPSKVAKKVGGAATGGPAKKGLRRL